MVNIYFAGSIRGGRTDIAVYREIIRYLKTKGNVLTEHVADQDLTDSGEKDLSDIEIYKRDLHWLRSSDYLIAEVTSPSLGVGFEIATAVEWKKRIICLFRKNSGQQLSAMIAGCESIRVVYYCDISEIKAGIDSVFNH